MMHISTGAMPGWNARDSKDNALATATRAAPGGGLCHYITAVLASYTAPKTGLLTIKDGATVIGEYYIVNADVIALPTPIKATTGNAVSAELAASGTATNLGKVTVYGYTM